MNIFAIGKSFGSDTACPIQSAEDMCDKHIPKMIVESAQMLSTAHRVLDGHPVKRPSKSGKTKVTYYQLLDNREDVLYKAVHINHPCSVWCRENIANYSWLYKHMLALGREFESRFMKSHRTIELLEHELMRYPTRINMSWDLTPHPLAMPDEYKTNNVVESYRNYYRGGKKHFAKWEKGSFKPEWWETRYV